MAVAKFEIIYYFEIFYNHVRRYKHLDQLSSYKFDRNYSESAV
jgi:hypothetical protein